ncbi:unnamed protein product [Clonostachys rosea]|uniref:Inhibitor of growth protein N-terminal histone-binding domain-containing protein n=1 Tax=Bionectria ochroleuca TaxID=29856 RepID=A0ABY6UIF5_BIOOC|nr:unnamed protein product [Clonostachys rosea]
MAAQVDDSPLPAPGQLTAPSQEDLTNVPSEVVRLLDFLQTGEQDLQFLTDLRDEHIADLKRQPIVLRRVDSVKEGAGKALGQVRQVVDAGLEKVRQSRSPFRKRNARKFAESTEFRSQEAIITRHHAAILRELVHLRQLALRSPTPGQKDQQSSRDSVVSAESDGPRSIRSFSTTSSKTDKPKFDNIGLLADLMGESGLTDSKLALLPRYSAITRSTFPLAEMHANSGHRTDSVSSCPPTSFAVYGKGSILNPAELSAEPNTNSDPVELPGDIPTSPPVEPVSTPSANNESAKKGTPTPEPSSSPPPQPETRPDGPLRSITFDPTDDGDLQPFSPLDDLTPFIQPPPVVEEKQVVEDQSFFGPASISVYEEKEVVVRHSQRKKSSQRILLNEQDRAGLALLMGDDMGYSGHSVAHKSSAVSLVSISSQTGTSITWPSPAVGEKPVVIPPVPTQPPPPPPVPPKIPHGTIPRKPTPSQSSSTTSLPSQKQTSASSSNESVALAVKPLTTIPPELLLGQLTTSQGQLQTVPAIIVQKASP